MAVRDENADRITRMGSLVDSLSRQLEAVREEGRVISSTLKERAIEHKARALAAERAVEAAKRRADIREARTLRLTRRRPG